MITIDQNKGIRVLSLFDGISCGRVADRNRGWAKCCSKSCAATLNNRKTGNYARFCYKRAVAIAIENGDYVPDYEDCGGFDNTSCQNEE